MTGIHFELAYDQGSGMVAGFRLLMGDVGGVLVFVPHLLSADNTCKMLAMINWSSCNCFKAVSNLKLNMRKSGLISIRYVYCHRDLADIIGCLLNHLLSTYLGLPVGASFKFKTIWDTILEKWLAVLAGWKTKWELTLLENALFSLLTYYLSILLLSLSINNRLDRYMMVLS